MSTQIKFETAENVFVNYQPAGLGTRFTAWVIDNLLTHTVTLLLVFGFIAIGVVFDEWLEHVAERIAYHIEDDKAVKALLIAMYISVVMLIVNGVSFLYYFLFEYFGHGRTLGKRWLSIRVIGENGCSLNSSKVFLRNVFRIVDSIPLAWLIPLFSKRSKRLGDMVAGTLVVLDKPGRLVDVGNPLTGKGEQEFHFSRANLDLMTEKEALLISQLLARGGAMDEPTLKALYQQTVSTLAQKFNHEEPPLLSHKNYLKELLQRYYQRQHSRLG